MALTKCKECGEKVSSKAKTCPSCGASVPKSTSLGTWLVLFLIIFGVYAVSQSPTPTPSRTSSSSSTSSAGIAQRSPAPLVTPSWRNFSSTDDLTGARQFFSSSPRTTSSRRMNFPYTDTESWIGVGCDDASEWVYVGFSNAPNLTNNDPQSGGYSRVPARVRWNESVENINMTQEFGAAFIHFQQDANVIQKMADSNSFLLELSWYGEGSVVFDYSLNGSSSAIESMRTSCNSL